MKFQVIYGEHFKGKDEFPSYFILEIFAEDEPEARVLFNRMVEEQYQNTILVILEEEYLQDDYTTEVFT